MAWYTVAISSHFYSYLAIGCYKRMMPVSGDGISEFSGREG